MKPRKPDWPERLERSIRAASGRRFRYGRHDCCLAVCGAVRAMTGQDLAKGLRGYSGRAGVQAVIDRFGGFERMVEGITERNGLQEVAPAFAQRGDIVLVDPSPELVIEGSALGIVDLDGRHCLIASRVGWQAVPLRNARRAWRIE